MNGLVVENIRLKELMLVVNKNKPFFEEFKEFISFHGYPSIYHFINDPEEIRIKNVILIYFNTNFRNCLYDGIARPYPSAQSNWFFITWLLRDAPQQRLRPILSSLIGPMPQRKADLVSELVIFTRTIFTDPLQWEWPAIAEVMLDRLEGSRRALKGSLFEAIVRANLSDLFKKYKLDLTISPGEVRINDETYDVVISSPKEKILMPVKTRETMGGGHALLFTRDIHKSISVAHENGYNCIPVVIAESWAGDLNKLPCENHIYIPLNPNQVEKLTPILQQKLESMVGIFSRLQ
ncbi:hypothetical protein [Enterobacter hormaechei]|uniref:hypothetical protein n=1 Tax=Enterobacter hormaechei TaxID=158836 RepID=UPI0012549EFC|nr:hypothetical protein [Enterobacter hormaechei]VAK42459.1 Uncharacterised protein [Enterobacter hormaechei]